MRQQHTANKKKCDFLWHSKTFFFFWQSKERSSQITINGSAKDEIHFESGKEASNCEIHFESGKEASNYEIHFESGKEASNYEIHFERGKEASNYEIHFESGKEASNYEFTSKVEKKPVTKNTRTRRVTFEKGEKLTSTEPSTKAAPKAPVTQQKEPKTSALKTKSIKSDKDDEEELSEEQEDALKKEIMGDLSSSEGEDSSDEEIDDTFESNAEVIALNSKIQKKLESKVSKDKRTLAKVSCHFSKACSLTLWPLEKKSSDEPGVLYLGRIPHGFYEEQMKKYFEQFGDVICLRLARNKKTGKSKHFGFIKFASKEVAEIVAETMHNYSLKGRLFQCKPISRGCTVRMALMWWKQAYWNQMNKFTKTHSRVPTENASIFHGQRLSMLDTIEQERTNKSTSVPNVWCEMKPRLVKSWKMPALITNSLVM